MLYWLMRRIHSSWLLAISAVGIFCGIALAPALSLGWVNTLGWLLTGITLCLFAVIRQRTFVIFLAVIGGLLIGLWRGSGSYTALEAYRPLVGKTESISGIVADDSDISKKGDNVLRLRAITWQDSKMPGTMWVTLDTKTAPVQRSDRVTIEGTIEKGFGTFAAVMYGAELKQVERPEPGDIALKIRNWFAGAVRTVIPEPEASLGVGYLVGQRRNLPPELDSALQIAGLTHIVVASGYNLTILVRLARRLFEKASKYLSALVSGSLIIGFIAVTGMSPSMSRAGLVAGLSLAAWYYGRKFHPLVLLPVAAAITVLVNPSYAWGDVGWQLSFAAFTGVMIMAPLLQAYYFGNRKPGTFRQILGETFAAWLCTIPILMLTFGYISNVAIFANLLILPLVPFAMLLVFVAGIGALALPIVAPVIALPAQLLLGYMTQTAQFMATVPWAQTEVSVKVEHTALMYALLAVFCLYMRHKTRFSLRDTNIIE